MPPVAFPRHVQDVGEQLADATWSPSEYEYAVVELPAVLGAPRMARRWASAARITGSLKEAERDDVMLLISELVTNAVRHVPNGPDADTVTVAVGVATPRLRIEVCDSGEGFSIDGVDLPAPDSPDGRGLFIVDTIATRWGASRGGRHCVWTELER